MRPDAGDGEEEKAAVSDAADEKAGSDEGSVKEEPDRAKNRKIVTGLLLSALCGCIFTCAFWRKKKEKEE